VFVGTGDIWKQIRETIHRITADDWFGTAVPMSGDGSISAITALYSGENGSKSDSVQVFQHFSKRITMQETQAKRNNQSIEWVQIGQNSLVGYLLIISVSPFS